MFKDIHFANPSAAYYFVVGLGLIALFGYSIVMRKKILINFAEPNSLNRLLFLERRTLLRYVCLSLVWFLVTLALMGPQKVETRNFVSEAQTEILEEQLKENTENETIITRRQACDLIFLVDASASMEIKDTRTRVSRLDYAKEIIDEMISQMEGQNVALYAFTSEVTPLVPPTLDYLFTRLMVRHLRINQGDVAGTDLMEALDLIGKKHFSKGGQKQQVLILLTDGGDTYLESLKGKDRENQIAMILDKMNRYKDQKVSIFTIGLGTKQGAAVPDLTYEGQKVVSNLDAELLTRLSEVGEGRYFFANDYSAPKMSQHILDTIRKNQTYVEEELTPQKKMERSLLNKSPQNLEVIHYYQYPLALAILLLGVEILIPSWPLRKKQVELNE